MLSDRHQQVFANGVLSSPLPVLSGTPQGAALSPIFFAIFMGTVGEIVGKQLEEEGLMDGIVRNREEEGLWTLMFANDTKAAGAITNNQQMNRLQKVLDKFYEWTTQNDMLVNAGKTECLRIGKLEKENNYKTLNQHRYEIVTTLFFHKNQ